MGNLFNISEVTVSYKYSQIYSERQKITSSHDVVDIGRQALGELIEIKEAFYIILLNNANQILGIAKLSEGGITGTLVDIRLLFQQVLKCNAVSIIMFHNHPSGTLKASQADKNLTKKIQDAGKFLDIKILDHVIITADSYLSFADEGML